MDTSKQSPIVSRSAAILIVICFFFPWVTISCSGIEITASGWELATGVQEEGQQVDEEQAEGDALYFIVPIVAIVVLGASFLTFGMARMAYFAGGAVGLAYMAYVYFDFQSDIDEAAQQGIALDLDFEIGWWLTLLAFLAVLLAGYLAGQDEAKEAAEAWEAQERNKQE